MSQYFTGWLIFLGLVYTTGLYFMNVLNPVQKKSRVWLHCTVGKITLLPTIVHLISFPFDGFNYLAIWSAVGLIFITIGTGFILSYLPKSGKIRFHARSIHPALVIGIIVAVVHHVIIQLELF